MEKPLWGTGGDCNSVVVAVLRALGPWCIQETIHTAHDVKVGQSKRAFEADSLETVMVAGQGTEEVWLRVAV